MKIQIYVLTSMVSGRILIVTNTLEKIEKFLKNEWLKDEPKNYKEFKEYQDRIKVDIVRALELIGFHYDIKIERFEDELEVTLGDGLEFDFKKIAKEEFEVEEIDEDLLQECIYDFCNDDEIINPIDDKIRTILKERL